MTPDTQAATTDIGADTTPQESAGAKKAPKPLTTGKQSIGTLIGLWAIVIGPFVALIAAVPLTWGWGLSWVDIAIAAVLYLTSGLGVTIGYHRYLTHGGFKAKRAMRVSLAVAGSLAVEGNVIQWVADHRRHHAYTDQEGDPHSPWRFGTGLWPMTKGLLHAHIGWMFHRELSNRERFAPDLVADKDLRRVDDLFPALFAISLLAPALAGGLITMSWQGALSAFIWGGLIRIGLLHHVTWSVNSICHVFGERPFDTRTGDKAANFWPLAILSMGESWHNLHHSDPTCARHGVLRGQIDISARAIWIFERFGWVYKVRWPNRERLSKKMSGPQATLRA